MKVVLDTNVLVSALIKPRKPRDLLQKLSNGRQLVLSRAIFEEFLEVITDPKVARYLSEDDTTLFLNSLTKAVTMIRAESKFKAVQQDPDDDMVVWAAYDANADYIVSGDRHLLNVKEFKGIKILTVDEMLSKLSDQATT